MLSEINLSSSDRESPERGRMSQILMRTERDLGVMVSFGTQKTQNFFKNLSIHKLILQDVESNCFFENHNSISANI